MAVVAAAAAPFTVDPAVPVDLDEAYICIGIMRAAMDCVERYTFTDAEDAEAASEGAVGEQAAQVMRCWPEEFLHF